MAEAIDRAVVAAFGARAPGPAASMTPSGWTIDELGAAERLLADRYANPAWHADPDAA